MWEELYEIVEKITKLMVPSRALGGFKFQVKRNGEIPKLIVLESDFGIWFTGGNMAGMHMKGEVVMVTYRGAATINTEPATDQVQAKQLFEQVMKMAPIEATAVATN